jgi:hypothetical protein
LAPEVKGNIQPRFFRPYRVKELINDVAVRLELPHRAKLDDVFHVGLLKKWVGDPPASPPPLPNIHHGAVTPELEQVVRARLSRGVRQVLVHWKGQSMASTTWEDLDTFRDKYPDLQLEDELDIEGGGEMSCGAAPTTGACKISNILPISNICPIGNIFPISNSARSATSSRSATSARSATSS